jgi:hypothetical protein
MEGPSSLYLFSADHRPDPKLIIEALLNGTNIIFVDPRLFPELQRMLLDLLVEAESSHEQDLTKRIQALIQYIEEEPERQAVSDLLSQPVPTVVVKPPALTDEQVEAELESIWSTQQIKSYSADELDLVVAGFRQRSADFIAANDYLNARKADEFAQILISHGQLGTVEVMQDSRVRELREKLDECRRCLAADKAKWECLLCHLRGLARDELDRLRESQEREIAALERLRASDPPPPARKYSNALLQLRRSERAQVARRDFSGAGETKAVADAMQRDEDADQVERWRRQIAARMENARRVHAKQIRVRNDHWRNEELVLVDTANKEVQLAEVAIAHLGENLRLATEARNTAANLREEKELMAQAGGAAALPRLMMKESPTKGGAEYRQRQILNAKIYTRLPAGRSGNTSGRPTKGKSAPVANGGRVTC